MKIVAYYHEETDAHGVTRKSVGLEKRETVVDEPCVLERDALAEIERLESMVNRSIQANYELRAELAALKAQEPVAWLQRPDLESDDSVLSFYSLTVSEKRIGWTETPLYAAPVQQVSVPDGLELIKRMQVCLSLDDTEWGLSAPEKYKLLGDIKSYVLAAPAAPAADAGHVFYGMDGNHP